jgi:O-acetylserine/cysteine efflux transporter
MAERFYLRYVLPMPFSHLALATLVMVIWGVNFVFMRWAVDLVSPTVFTCLRFFAAALPLIFFLPRPKVPLGMLIGYGATGFTLQFALLFTAIQIGMPAGLASLVMQSQVFFTLILAIILAGERPTLQQLLGLLLGVAGITIVGIDFQFAFPALAFMLTLLAAFFWGVSNTFVRAMGPVQALSLVVWGSALSGLMMLPFSLWIDGIGPWRQAFVLLWDLNLVLIACLAFNAYGATIIGYGLWAWLLKRHPAGVITPFTLLVPFVGMASAALVLNESVRPVAWIGIAFVMSGLTLNQLRPFGMFKRKFKLKLPKKQNQPL